MYIGLYVKYLLFLSDFNEAWIFRTLFLKITQISNFTKIRPLGTELFYADRRTEGRDEANSRFPQFYERA